jgi:hypothetical protein
MATANQPQQSLYTIVKGRFKAIDTNTFGLFLIFMNNNLRVAESVTIIASHFSSMYETDPKLSWSDVEERIMNLKWKGEFATSISRDTQTFVENAFKGVRSEELYSLIKSNAVSKIENLLSMMLVKPLGDKNIHIELSWENASAEQIQNAKQERELRDAPDGSASDDMLAPQPEPDDTFRVDEGSVVLEVNFVLAPVSGIPIFELQPGDRIMVKINPATKRGLYFIELLNARHDEEIVPVPGTVTELKLNKSNEYVVLVKIGEGIFGKVIEAEQVKIKRFDPNTDKKTAANAQRNLAAAGFTKAEPVTKQDKAIRNLYWLMYLGGFVVLAVIMVIVAAII